MRGCSQLIEEAWRASGGCPILYNYLHLTLGPLPRRNGQVTPICGQDISWHMVAFSDERKLDVLGAVRDECSFAVSSTSLALQACASRGSLGVIVMAFAGSQLHVLLNCFVCGLAYDRLPEH